MTIITLTQVSTYMDNFFFMFLFLNTILLPNLMYLSVFPFVMISATQTIKKKVFKMFNYE